MKHTSVSNLDEALAVLNAARQIFHPDHLSVGFDEAEVDGKTFPHFVCDGGSGDLPVEFDRAIGLVQHAAFVANRLSEDLTIIEDHNGNWVAINRA